MKRIVLSQSDTINNPIQMKRPYSTSDILKALKNLVTGGITVTKGKGDHIRVESTTDSNLKGTLTTPKCSKSMLGSCLQYLGLEISGNDFVRTYL